MFKIGDEVRILDTENKDYYKQILTKKGTIAQITNYKYFADDVKRTKYYVEIPEFQNEFQSDCLWVFHNATSLGLISDEVTCDDQITEIDDIIKGVNNNMMNEILEIYNERELKKINEKYNEMEQTIKQTDPRYKIWKECVDTLEKLYQEDKVLTTPYAPIALADETMKKLSSMFDDRRKELDELYYKKVEVNAQLSMCETYEQKQEILRRYNIINKNGKING